MNWRPRVVYDPGGEETIDFELPQRPWDFAPTTVGGSRRAASGVGAAYEVRPDDLVEKHLRFTEEEWPAVRAWLLWAQNLQPFEFWDEQTDETTKDVVTLEEPRKGEPIKPTRDPQFPLVFELTITVRMEA